MASKFEKLIEYIINEDEAKAKELFHNIVISKSREIYESLADEESIQSNKLSTGDHFADELSQDEDIIDGDHFQESEEDLDSEDMGDEDLDSEEFGDEEGEGEFGSEEGEDELEDRVMDLEDAIDELKAEFDSLMADEENEEENFPGIHDEEGSEEDLDSEEESDLDSEEDMGDEDLDSEEFGDEERVEESNSIYSEARKSPSDLMREYVEKVTLPNAKSEDGKLIGDDGSVPVNKKSVQTTKKNDMGGTTANIARGGSNASPDGTAPKKASNYGTKSEGDLPGAGKFQNVPGAKAGVKSLSKVAKPADKDGAPAGAKNTDPASQNKTSVIESKKVVRKATRK